jgi:hypothetical protein
VPWETISNCVCFLRHLWAVGGLGLFLASGVAVAKVPMESFSVADPRVWLLQANREQLGLLLEEAFNDRYESYNEEAVPKLNEATLVSSGGLGELLLSGFLLWTMYRT